MATIDNLEYLNLNTYRSYPIKEGLTKTSTDGFFVIPDSLFVDLTLGATSDIDRRFYISKINNFIDTLGIEISDDLNVLAGTFLVTKASHSLYKTYKLTPSDAYAGANGLLVVANLENLTLLPTGAFTFEITASEFETRTVVPSLSGLNRVIFKNAAGDSFSLTGNVTIEVRTNLRFTFDSLNNKITLDSGEGLGLNKVCTADTIPISTINGIPPDDDGNFSLDFSDCASLTVLPSGTGLLLNDVCCKPCIGCDEIGTLTDRLISLETDLITLRDYFNDLLRTFNDFKTTVTFTCSC